MKLKSMKIFFAFAVLFLGATGISNSQISDTLYLWPDTVPGENEAKHPAVVTDNASGNTIRLTDVTDPMMVVFAPEENVNNGKGIIVCPGGGYSILSINKEGYEIAEWLSGLGFTAFVLQYRVPGKKEGALMDIQRAIRMVRANSDAWNLNADEIGVIGFSAGGSLSARASTLYDMQTYSPVDKMDSASCRPDYAILIYPAYLDLGENRRLTPELKVDSGVPPMFIFATADDSYGNSALVMTTALRDAKVPVELHFLPFGGHGYGLREGNTAGETWPKLAEKWLNQTLGKVTGSKKD